MPNVSFIYEGVETTYNCKSNEKIKDIFQIYASRENLDVNKLIFLYNGIDINREKNVEEIINQADKERDAMNILVFKIYEEVVSDNLVKSKDIICPKCQENTFIQIKNFKIHLLGCKNGHNLYNISLEDFENLQNVDLSKIICQSCKTRNKGIIYNNEFYRCFTCNLDLCPDCKTRHAQEHKIINYDKKNYVCNLHRKNYVNFCEDCKENICLSCESSHRNHKLSYFGNILPDDNMDQKLTELKININSLNLIIDEINSKLQNVKKSMGLYYSTFENLIKIYNEENTNYQLMKNINEFMNNNKFIIEKIKKIKTSILNERPSELMNLYYLMNKNKYLNITNDESTIIQDNEESDYKIIIDNGSSSIKFGIGGIEYQTIPEISTCIGYSNGNNGKDKYIIDKGLEQKRDNLTLEYPMNRGIINDWDIMEKLYDNIFYNQLKINTSEHNILLTELPFNSNKNRENLLEYMFEVYNAPCMSLVNQSWLALYAAAKFTGLVVDLSDSYNHFYPIFDEHTNKYIKWSKSGGKDLTEFLYKSLKESGQNIKYLEYAKIVKENCCYTAYDFDEEIKLDKTIEYQLPDSTIIKINDLRYRCPEMLFNGEENESIAKICVDVIQNCKSEEQIKELTQNIVLSGGNSMFKGLPERLTKEIKRLLPYDLVEEVKVIAFPERKNNSFTGGNYLSQVSTFNGWIQKSAYEEEGKTIVHKKCPNLL